MKAVIRTDLTLIKNREKMNRTIASFWNQTSRGWLKIWGPHIHHGYYEENTKTLSPIQAQEILIEKLVNELEVPSKSKILDVGCGMGGSTCYLAKNYQADVTGISLSKEQINIAKKLAEKDDIASVEFKLEDALSMKTLPSDYFDIIWSLESCEQFTNKALFLEKAFSKLKSGGKLMLATWCSSEEEFSDSRAKQYYKLCKAFDLPYMPTLKHYETLISQQGYSLIKSLDWTNHVKESWQIGQQLVKRQPLLYLLKLGGLRGIRFSKQLKYMHNAFNTNLIRYGVFIATKP